MVTKITHPKDIHRAIYYNEHKVADQAATLLLAQNFLKDTNQLNLVEKKERFDQLIVLNRRGERNTLHVSLNFAPGEQIPEEKLLEIAQEYMQLLGFGDQPFLVYQHLDAGHPHLHIVTTNIRPDGHRIDMNFIGRDKSEPARKAIEEKYELVKAEEQMARDRSKDEFVQKIQYGKKDTRRAITNTLEYVLKTWRFRSLAELNTILRLYNLKADRGQPGSRIYRHRGLVYHVLDDKGQPIGVPTKASSIWFKPGLDFLEKKFREQAKIEPDLIGHVRAILDMAFLEHPRSLEELIALLRREKIEIFPYVNTDGKLYGLHFIDLRGKFVLKASALGKGYSARKILAQLGLDPFLHPLPLAPQRQKNKRPLPDSDSLSTKQPTSAPGEMEKLLGILFRPEDTGDQVPYELSKDKKKKNKGRHR